MLDIKLKVVPTKDVYVILVSGSYNQTYGILKPFSEFKLDVERLAEGTYDLMITIADSAELVAQCQLVVGSSAVVSFDSDGGSGTMSPVLVEPGSTYTVPECAFEPPAGRYFEHWVIKDYSEDPVEPGQTITVYGPVVLKAVWGNIVYSVSYLPGDGSGQSWKDSAIYGQEIVLPENPFSAPDGEDFRGWSIGDETYQPGDVYVVTGDTEVTAEWGHDSGLLLIALIVIAVLALLLIVLFWYRRRRERGSFWVT